MLIDFFSYIPKADIFSVNRFKLGNSLLLFFERFVAAASIFSKI